MYRVQALIYFFMSTVLMVIFNLFFTFYFRFLIFMPFCWSSCNINLFWHFFFFGEDLRFIPRFGFSILKQVAYSVIFFCKLSFSFFHILLFFHNPFGKKLQSDAEFATEILEKVFFLCSTSSKLLQYMHLAVGDRSRL